MIKEYPIFLAGKWKSCRKASKIINPFSEETLGRVHQAGRKEIEEALRESERGFRELRQWSVYQRSLALQKITDGIRTRFEDFAQMICREVGKPIRDARTEVSRAILVFQTAAEEAKRINGEVIPLDLLPGMESRFGIIRRFPVGPVLGITPFNFPLNLVCHKIAPAIASGNSIVIKPAIQAPLTALLLGEVIAETGLPAGSVSILPCANHLAEKMVLDDRFKILSFTGSARVGWALKSKAGKKKVMLELGGNAGVIVHEDSNLDYAAKRCAVGGFAFAGQSCISVQRIYVHERLSKRFTDRFVSLVKGLKTGDPMEEKTDIGPMIDEGASIRTEQRVAEAVKRGAKVLTGGKRKRNFFQPTVLTRVTSSMRLFSEEVFAPLVTVTPYTDFEKVISDLNHSAYGLQAGLFTHDLNKALYAYQELEVGGLMVNEVPSFRVDPMPYGGVKDSGLGREGVRYAIDEMTEMKLLGFYPQAP